MNNFFIFENRIKVKDFTLFPGLKSNKKNILINKYSKIICRIITNLSLLTIST
jgi:hypothetical protein